VSHIPTLHVSSSVMRELPARKYDRSARRRTGRPTVAIDVGAFADVLARDDSLAWRPAKRPLLVAATAADGELATAGALVFAPDRWLASGARACRLRSASVANPVVGEFIADAPRPQYLGRALVATSRTSSSRRMSVSNAGPLPPKAGSWRSSGL
jgi:hypothetical protein